MAKIRAQCSVSSYYLNANTSCSNVTPEVYEYSSEGGTICCAVRRTYASAYYIIARESRVTRTAVVLARPV